MHNATGSARIRAEQVRLIYRNYPFTLSANFVLSVLMIGALWGDVPAGVLLGWGAFSGTITMKGAWDFLHYRRALSGPTPTAVDVAARRFGEIAWCTGAMWGGAGLSPFLVASPHVHQVLFPAITGMAFGGAAFLSTDRRLFYGYIVPMLGLTLVGVAGMDEGNRPLFIGLTLALAFATLAFAHNVHAMIQRSLVLRFENMDLIDALKLQKEQADYANLSKSRFLAAASHDLRQPMHALGLLFESLRPHIADEPSQHLVQSITTTIHTLEDLFNALLDISKLDAGVIQCDVQAVLLHRTLARIEAEFRPVAERKGLRFAMHAPAQGVAVRSDPALLDRMVRNLVNNAIQHTRQGTVLVACRPRAGTVLVQVRDSGPGIPPELHKEIFQEFYQIQNLERDRSNGVGLGLAIVERLSRMLNHPVSLRSSPGCGSTFTVELPRSAPGPAAAATPMAQAIDSLQSLRGRSIAAIDDDPIVLDSMRELFVHWGCSLTAAASADELLAKLTAEGIVPEVVISDYRLRNGETGAQAIARVVSFCGHPIPGVLVTGDTAPERLREAAQSGHAVLHKPVRPGKLRALLLHLLDGPLP
ncbi:hybrid sensor histidine kinase/response regulator [Acidovorax sp. ACV01]|uniref:ATP-binding response regulator n=1 Tax=Acidovorax sp. ACV01 TaxID=2769311 RepID=UPI001784D4D0|nr:hybrid sensor histidine kinase/response regulator [Acidovorax sp. ACV01]MBD9394545.1 hybrid sensor histidine kinase/response regulator [Acidovorax sp. ACV01]